MASDTSLRSARRRGVVALLALSLSLVASAAVAAPTLAQREEARRLMDEGRTSMKAGDRQRALEAFTAAHDLMHVPTTGLAVAKAQVAVGKLVEARATARDVVAMARQEREPAVFDEARKTAKELETELFGRIPTLALSIEGGHPTRVTVDGGAILEAQLADPLPLNPGKHVVLVRGEADTEKRMEVELKEGDVRKLSVTLPSADRESGPVEEDGPVEPAAPPATEGAGPSRTLMYGGFGLAAVGVAVGAVTGVMTLSKSKALASKCEDKVCAPEVQGELDTANTLATVSTIGFAAAGAGLVLGIIGIVLPKTASDDTAKASVSLRVGLGEASVVGRF